MIGFPFDSHVTYDEDGNPIYDRAISSEPFRNLLKELFKTGIMPTVSTNLQVIAGEGMTVTVKAGFAMVEGCMKLEENDRVLSVQASSSFDRIDTVVLRLNNNDNARYCDLYIVEGTPASAPVRPALTRNDSVYELGLADLFIAKNTSVIQDYRITDTRYEAERCGVISSISEFDTESLNRQIQDWTQEQQAEFTAWVETIKGILDEATAGHLQNEIENLGAEITQINNDLSVIRSHVGMIIHSTTLDTEEKVKAIYGGTTWTKLEGVMLLGASASYAIGSTGGSATNTISVDNLPAHNHTVGAHAHGLNSHTHGFAHTHGTDSKGSHTHSIYWKQSQNSDGNHNRWYMCPKPDTITDAGVDASGAHTHTTNSQSTSTTGGASGNTANSSQFNSGSTGGGMAINNLPPYKSVYIWERTA